MPPRIPKLSSPSSGRRVITMLALASVVALPAGILRASCIGDTCKDPAAAKASDAPFCSLPDPLRQQIASGYRKGRSPEVLGVAAEPTLGGPVGPEWRAASSAPFQVPWPALGETTSVRVALGGAGLRQGEIPSGGSLEDIAPTVAAAIGLERPHPDVRSGEAWAALVDGPTPALVLEIVWKGAWPPVLQGRNPDPFRQISELGAGSERVGAGSVPADPAALLATLGSGGVPNEHGITGSYIRGDDGRLVEAWTDEAPSSVIAMLGDDLDEWGEGDARTGLIGDSPTDRGLTGSDWYLSGDIDEAFIKAGASPAQQTRRAEKLLASGFGDDDVPDLLAVTFASHTSDMAAATLRLIDAAEREAPGDVMYVLVGLGEGETYATTTGEIAEAIEAEVGAPVIEAVAGGGFFTDQEILAAEGIAEDAILQAMDQVRTPQDQELFADRFTGVAVTFERYC